MTRAAALVLCLLGLVASGYAFVHNGYRLHRGGSVPFTSGTAATDLELQTAASQLLQAKAAVGTYDSIDLKPFHNLYVVRANETSYCIQIGNGPGARYVAGPGGRPAPGTC